MSNEKGLLVSERLPDEVIVAVSEEDAPAVDNDEEIRQKVRDVIESKSLEVRTNFAPIGVLNHSINAEGKFTKAAVLDKLGVPKPIDNLNTDKNTSVQIFSPDDGDILLEYNEGDENVSVKAATECNPENIDELIDQEFYAPTMDYLASDEDTTYFIIDGHNSLINGMDMNQAFARRNHLSKILDGVDSPIKDQLANWLDRSNMLNQLELDWKHAYRLDGSDIKLNISYNLNGGKSTLTSQQAIVWREIGGALRGELIQLNLNPATYLAGANDGFLAMERIFVPDEYVTRVMVIQQVDDEAMSVTFYTEDGTPSKAIPWIVLNTEVEHHATLLDMFDIEEEVEVGNSVLNDPYFKSDAAFDLSLIEHKNAVRYVETRVIIEKDIVETFNVKDPTSVKSMTHDVFTKPMVHIFKSEEEHYRTDSLCFVNIPDEALLTEEERKDGTSTE